MQTKIHAKETRVKEIVRRSIKDFSKRFIKEYQKGGEKYLNIENKQNNFMIAPLGHEIAINSSLMRSFDSSLGNVIEKMALEIAQVSGYKVKKGVKGELSQETTNKISDLLLTYKDSKYNDPLDKKVNIRDYEEIKKIALSTNGKIKFHNSDYLLEREVGNKKELYLMELKIGGDLDNKKARSEKEAILEQYAILVQKYHKEIAKGNVIIKTFFATAYNKNSLDSGKENWKQGSVQKFFSHEELLIGKDFWIFMCDDKNGWNWVKNEYTICSDLIKVSLEKIIKENKNKF